MKLPCFWPRSNKSTNPTKHQASKGSKDPATTPKRAKKPEKTKTLTPSSPNSSPPTPSPSSFPAKADSEPTKKCRAKKQKATNEHISSSGKKKEVSKQASVVNAAIHHSQRTLPLPPDGSSPLPSSDPQDEPEEYSKKFKASGHVAWDPLAIHNICNVDREFKGGPGYGADNYIFNCNNQKRQTKSKHFVCEDKTCGAQLNTKGWERWYLVQVIPTSSHLRASDLAIKALQHLKPNNLKLVPTQEQLIKFISNKRITANPPPPKAL
ncbi:hypothetical protein DSO57_1019870, partial [Entomophthora muscae]